MSEQFSERQVDSAVEPCPRAKPLHWIEIELLGEDSSPIPWEEFCIEPPDGETIKGYLDENGWARLDGLADAGACKVSFPKLDKEAWRHDSVLAGCGTSPERSKAGQPSKKAAAAAAS